MRIAVTGGSGLVGRRIVGRLLQDYDVVNIDLNAPSLTPGTIHAHRHLAVDVMDVELLSGALSGVSAVVHAAGIPGPSFGTEEQILSTNVGGTRNVALSAARAGVHRIVFISSESVLGFVFGDGRTRPDYFPIDESHRLAPTEAYGRSKLLAEAELARSMGPDTVALALRPPWVWVPEEYDRYRAMTTRPEDWWDGLWAYVHGDDLAEATALSVKAELGPGFKAFYVSAPDNGTVHETRKLVDRYYPGVELRNRPAPFASLISSDGLDSVLGFRPNRTWREFL